METIVKMMTDDPYACWSTVSLFIEWPSYSNRHEAQLSFLCRVPSSKNAQV